MVDKDDNMVEELLHAESEYLKNLAKDIDRAAFSKIKNTKNYLETNNKKLQLDSNLKISELESSVKQINSLLASKGNVVKSMTLEISELKRNLCSEQLSHKKTKEVLYVCQDELRSTGEDMETFFRVSESDRKKIHGAYLEMREKAVEESLKVNKFETDFSLLKLDKENCEVKLEKKKKQLNKLSKELEKNKSTFQKSIINKEALQQQLQYTNVLKAQLCHR